MVEDIVEVKKEVVEEYKNKLIMNEPCKEFEKVNIVKEEPDEKIKEGDEKCLKKDVDTEKTSLHI